MWICSLAVLIASIVCVSQGRSVVQPTPTSATPQWTPSDGRSRDEWLRCHGQPADVCQRMADKLKLLESKATDKLHQNFPHTRTLMKSAMQVEERLADTEAAAGSDPVVQSTTTKPTSKPAGLLDGCSILLTEGQIDQLLALLAANTSTDSSSSDEHNNSRKKRQTVNFQTSPNSLWSLPIVYKFDGSQSVYQMATIRDAFHHWTDNTCVRFREISTTTPYSDNHILLTSTATGCNSYVGKISYKPQQINLQDVCLSRFGTPVHEIGHSLGLWHQQMRSDRDESIQVVWDNIVSVYLGQFYKISSANVVPYNFGSVMHYGPTDGSSVNGESTMRALNPLYQRNMGQRTGLSFEDIRAINIAYCSSTCASTPLAQPCQRGGYQDPNNCTQCKCTDGFSGQYCDQLAAPVNANCGGVINLERNGQTTIKSPGYDDPQYYLSYRSCNWHIKVPENYVAELQFVGDFAVYCQYGSCHHWVEVKYKEDLGLEGPRFCCNGRPNVTVKSQASEMLIVFRSNFSNDILWTQRGFQAIIRAVPFTNPAAPSTMIPTTTSTTTIPTTTTTTTRTTTTTASTTSTTTPKQIASSSPAGALPSDKPTTTTTRTPSTTATRTSSTTSNLPSMCDELALTFLLDSSNSVSASDLSTVVNFVSSLTARYSRTLPDTRVAVVTYSSQARVASPLGDSLSDTVSSLTPAGTNNRNISGALRVAQTMIYDAIPLTTDKVIVVITTAGATVDTERTLPDAETARRAGLRLVVLGIGPLVNGTEAAEIAGSDSLVVYADSFSSLVDSNSVVADQLASKICRPNPMSASPGSKIWSCSFEPSPNTLCGMVQDQTDQFDWTVFSGPTPSNPTGPDAAYDGNYYIYIEASEPRVLNDEARLFFPRLNATGTVCVDFQYHMFGFHINTLRVVQRNVLSPTTTVSSTVWMRSRDMGNTWHRGNIEVSLSSNSQLLFVASRGEAFSGDIGLDAVNVFAGSCPKL